MKFLHLKVADAIDAVLAHAISINTKRFQKGRVLSAADCEHLQMAGFDRVWAAQMKSTDIGEDLAARAIALEIAGNSNETHITDGVPHGGRCNLMAARSGILTFDVAVAHALNNLDPAITLATLLPFARVRTNQMIGTIKIIPFAVDRSIVADAQTVASQLEFKVSPFRPRTATMILTRVPGDKDSLLQKAETVTRARLKSLGCTLQTVATVPHTGPAVLNALNASRADITLILGGSAIADIEDIVPSAIIMTGGKIVRLGMPVDPGNLLCLANHADGRPIIGLPGCARSPKLNGFDWVLERLCAGLEILPGDIAAMGVGGLLDDIAERGVPRPRAPRAVQ
jgi:molybdenum cofactor cytidylyltransferase